MTNGNAVICIGELLIDFFCTERGTSLVEGKKFEKQAGGAPANVAAMIAALGGSVAFAGKVGNDSFGDFLIGTLKDLRVDTSMIGKDTEFPTTLAFVSLTEDGERDFQFNRGADKNLSLRDLPEDRLMEAKILHFGSATAFLEGRLRDTYFKVMERGKANGSFISFDPNFRSDLWWGNEVEFIGLSKRAIALADFVKVSDEELVLLTGEEDAMKGIEALHGLGAGIVAVTKGSEGSLLSNGNRRELIPSPKIVQVDTTGAGDAFVGAVLHYFAEAPEMKRIAEDFTFLKETARKANALAAKVCTEVGALSALAGIAGK